MTKLRPIIGFLFTAFLLLGSTSVALAQYVIGEGDVLEVSFWQNTTLNRQVTVGHDGHVTLDIIGQIEAAGRTTEELQIEVTRQISRLNQEISQANVRVIVFNYNHVYLIGQVANVGRQAFEEIPDLWTIINESGGLTELGDLSRVTIIRGGDQAGKIEVVNLSEAITTGQLDMLPKIRRLDTIEIPRMPGLLPSPEVAALTEKKNVMYVMGAVNTPGQIGLQGNIDLVEAVALAGGPTADADLKKLHLIIKDGAYSQTVQFDLQKYATSGLPNRYILQPEDLIIVPRRETGFLRNNLGTIAAALGAASTLFLVIDQLRTGE